VNRKQIIKQTRQNLIDQSFKALPQTVINQVVDAFLETLKQQFADERSVQLRGFGTFKMKNRASRQGRNPKTGQPVEIEAKKVIRFKQGFEVS
jgi:nucleoid DNA-binding protein